MAEFLDCKARGPAWQALFADMHGIKSAEILGSSGLESSYLQLSYVFGWSTPCESARLWGRRSWVGAVAMCWITSKDGHGRVAVHVIVV
jgi:hypothetical protein